MGCNASSSEDVYYFVEDQEEEKYVRHPLIPCYDRNTFLIQELWEILGIDFPEIIMNIIDEFTSFNIADIALRNPESQTLKDNMFFHHTSISFWCKPYNAGRETIVLRGTLRDSRTGKKLCGWNFTCSAIGYFDFTLTEGAIRYSNFGTRDPNYWPKKMVRFGEWTHICGTYDPLGGTKVLYINGEVVYFDSFNIFFQGDDLLQSMDIDSKAKELIFKLELQKLKSLHWDDDKIGITDNAHVQKITNRISNVAVYSDTLSHEEVRILSKSRSRPENVKKMALTTIDGLESRDDRDGFKTVGCGPHWKADGLDLMIEVQA